MVIQSDTGWHFRQVKFAKLQRKVQRENRPVQFLLNYNSQQSQFTKRFAKTGRWCRWLNCANKKTNQPEGWLVSKEKRLD
jgi:hypothetical protein